MNVAPRMMNPHQTYTELLLKTYENQLQQRDDRSWNQLSSINPLYSPQSNVSPYNLALRTLMYPITPNPANAPPFFSFQNLLAQMTAKSTKSNESSTSFGNKPPIETDHRSSSIATLRKKAREHEVMFGVDS